MVLSELGHARHLRVPVGSLSGARLAVPRSRPSGALRGAGYGLLGGAAGGAAFGVLAGNDPDGFFEFSAGERAAIGAVFFGGTGLVVGGLVGAIAPGRRWEHLPAAPRAAVGRGPGGGVAVSVSLRL